MSYVPTIGLEVHAELKTVSKMFCGCKNEPHESEPNAHTCPVCLAHPGSLPVPNEAAIKKVLLFGKAVDATPATYSEFDRKNYFYPDIPKAYQISQYAYPFLTGGELKDVALTRVHLEEDTARSSHDKGDYSLVDFNRAGVPLMELVTEPVIHDAETAGAFARELQLLLRTLNISDANMERGEMRVEANISVSKTDEFGTKVEVKNLNSFKSVEGAIAFEIKRQTALLEEGKEVVQETRGWDEVNLRTFTQRVKETAKDYRYFPDPDIPKIKVSESLLSEIMPKLPNEKRILYKNLGLTSDAIELIISEKSTDTFFNSLLQTQIGTSTEALKLAANYLTSDLASLMDGGGTFVLANLPAEHFAELVEMLQKGEINSRIAKDLLPELFGTVKGPRAIATERNLLQISDSSALESIVKEIIEANPTVVAEYKAGKEASIQFFVGLGMKATRGSANPGVLLEAFKKSLLS
ncbi:MAG: Asp-tRNA(Asn)/Glu-tRNA(Gln) amidotransferase subunit GatB [Candidatus Pacebacteria bacterium]|nr:Asp-tRNA(Asn)/Glu-tRNA(Gln) amidotransferase subunit GatB [Candidatus Paceibacterota bacterium]MBP9842547.1 Asp-tRNA(Asn)/Glu-tRNA(Gln) amidotransferase subunit GatB [Candidatus Paceibacterota bacterium]